MTASRGYPWSNPTRRQKPASSGAGVPFPNSNKDPCGWAATLGRNPSSSTGISLGILLMYFDPSVLIYKMEDPLHGVANMRITADIKPSYLLKMWTEGRCQSKSCVSSVHGGYVQKLRARVRNFTAIWWRDVLSVESRFVCLCVFPISFF